MSDRNDFEDGEKDSVSDREKKTSPLTGGPATTVAAIAAVAGFLAVYMSGNPAGNLPGPTSDPVSNPATTSTSETASSVAPTPSEPGTTKADVSSVSQALRPLAKGDMGTFVVKKAPAPAPDKLAWKTFDLASAEETETDGKPARLNDWSGKVVLVNLWATWCAPCRKEMPDLVKLREELAGPDFELLAISIDRGGPAKPKRFLNEIGAQALGLHQGPTTTTSGPLKAFGMPTTVLFDRQGRELGRLVGPADWKSEAAKVLMRKAIEATRAG
ncbi:MAG: TlpA disulfide reductase family protein [Pseudomonadota bacterium]